MASLTAACTSCCEKVSSSLSTCTVSYKLKLSQSYKLEMSHLNSKGHHCRRLGGGAWRNAKRWKSERDLRTEGMGLFGACDSREVGIGP